VAHLTLRVPGPFAKDLTLTGRIVPGDRPATYTSRFGEGIVSCG
jgi:hypothetical protein